MCVLCLAEGKLAPATVVDHVAPHKGDQRLFWDTANWQALCKPCHDRHKQRQERTGVLVGADVSGMPVDAAHHWNAPK
jgi:5-methylcytosine-specific restriction endonuclease McrA